MTRRGRNSVSRCAQRDVKPAPRPAPERFRRRLTIVFVVACSVSAGALALGAYGMVWSYRWERFESRAQQQAETAAALLNFDVRPIEIPQIVTVFQEVDFGDIVATRGAEYFSSEEALGRDAIPDELAAPDVEPGTHTRTTVGGVSYHVVVHPLPRSATSLYFFFDVRPLAESLRELAAILAGGWTVVTACAAVLGRNVAKRTLLPVNAAARAAHALAEGLLDTRLPVGGRDEFATWATSFNEMADALQQKLHELSAAHDRERRFTGNVAHELMTPIGALVTEASVLEQHLDRYAPEDRRLLELAISDIRRLRRLAEDVLELARLDATGSATDRLKPVALHDAVARCLSATTDHDVTIDVPSDLVVRSDEACLERIVTNLVSNAFRHGRPPVRIRAERDHDAVVIHVEDHGDGLPPGAVEHLFDRFYKHDESRASPGFGLGLAIVRETTRLVGGSISAANTTDGARFTLRLPSV